MRFGARWPEVARAALFASACRACWIYFCFVILSLYSLQSMLDTTTPPWDSLGG